MNKNRGGTPQAKLSGKGRPLRRSLRDARPIGKTQQHIEKKQTTRPRRRNTAADFEKGLNSITDVAKSPKKRGIYRFKKLLKYSFLLTVFVGVVMAGYIGFKIFTFAQDVIVDRGDGALGLSGDIDPSQLKGEGDGRVNVLLVGIGGDGHEGANLSDVIMTVSIDPTNNTAAMLSIPRDLYLTIPGYYSTRINAAYALGEQDPDTTGAEVLTETVEGILDIDLHYFVQIDFQGFIEVIDRLGGVEVDVQEYLRDPFIEETFGGGYSGPFEVFPGIQQMDGPTALQYARSRKTTSDFDRARRQQIVLKAVKDKALSLGTFSNPLKIGDMLDSLGRNVKTNIQISEMLRMLEIAQTINNDTVRSEVLDNSAGGFLAAQNISGASVLVPRGGLNNFSEIQKYVKGDLFADGFITSENAAISVLNATNTPGLATELGEELEELGYNVVEIGNATLEAVPETTILYDNSLGVLPYTTSLLEKRLDIIARGKAPEVGQTGVNDIVIVIGADYIDD